MMRGQTKIKSIAELFCLLTVISHFPSARLTLKFDVEWTPCR